MTIFRKTLITVTVLHTEDFDPATSTLAEIAYEMGEGHAVGAFAIASSEIVAPDAIKGELLAVGNDGEFFEIELADDADEDGTSGQDRDSYSDDQDRENYS